MDKFILIKFEVEGIHRWKDCPFSEVSYLRDYHRHIFHFEVKMEVFHNDREVEFIMVKNRLQKRMSNILEEPVNHSCETLAQMVADIITELYGIRKVEITVLEDGENGGGITIN